MKLLDSSKTIKYLMSLKYNEDTTNWHIVFDDILAGQKLIVPILSLFSPISGNIYYDHKSGWSNSIVLLSPKGLKEWKDTVSPYIWPGIDGGKAFFMFSTDGHLIKPSVCCRCGAKNPPITETIVRNGRAVEVNEYCAHHGEYTQNLLIQAAGNG